MLLRLYSVRRLRGGFSPQANLPNWDCYELDLPVFFPLLVIEFFVAVYSVEMVVPGPLISKSFTKTSVIKILPPFIDYYGLE